MWHLSACQLPLLSFDISNDLCKIKYHTSSDEDLGRKAKENKEQKSRSRQQAKICTLKSSLNKQQSFR
jgi:hypothetical protein